MSADKGSSRADTLIKVVLVFFISLLSFSVGTFVGKQVSDSDHRRMALEGEFNTNRQTASTTAAQPGDKITDKEVDKLTQEFVNKEKSADQQAEAKQAQDTQAQAQAANDQTAKTDDSGYQAYQRAAAKPADAAKADTTTKVAEKVADGQAPSDGEPAPRKPASVLPSVASSAIGKYTVQVASYAVEKQALDHAAKLKQKGWEAFYLPATIHGHTWYRVLVGLFSTPKSAKLFRAKLIKEANTKSAIVQKIVR